MSDQQQDQKLFFMNLKPQTSKTGTTFYTGKMGSLDVMGFLKKDNSGTITLWVKQAPMRDYAGQQQQRPNYPPRQSPPPPPQQRQPPAGPPDNMWDGPDPEF